MMNAKTSVMMLALAISLAACKKKDDQENLDSKAEQHNNDNSRYKSELDQADNDVNDVLKDIPAFGKVQGVMTSSPLCGCTIDSSLISQKILFFNFDGVTPCGSPSRTRSGQIKVQLTVGQYWRDVNAQLTLTFNGYKVIRLSDNKSIQLDGVKKLNNVNGHDWIGFLLGTKTFKYRERAIAMNVKFDNNASSVWNSARITEWSYNPSTQRISFTANGDTTINANTNTDSWGTNRFGNSFVTFYNAPWQSNSYCGFWRPVSGQLIHRLDRDYTITLGVNQQGFTSNLDCAYGFKVNWDFNGYPQQVILSY